MIIRATQDGVRLVVHVQPGASRTELAGTHGEAIKVRLAAPPVDGKANEALLLFMAKLFEVARRDVALVRGEASRSKVIEVVGVDIERATELLLGT